MPRKTPQEIVAGDSEAVPSMRPRPDAAENAPAAEIAPTVPSDPSMRPRPDAAENADRTDQSDRRAAPFNEAAARCRGKRNERKAA